MDWRQFWVHVNHQLIVANAENPQRLQGNQVMQHDRLDRLDHPALMQMANLQNIANQGIHIVDQGAGLQIVRRRGRAGNLNAVEQ